MERKPQLKKSSVLCTSGEYKQLIRETPKTDYSTTATPIPSPCPSPVSSFYSVSSFINSFTSDSSHLSATSKNELLQDLEKKVVKLYEVVNKKSEKVNKELHALSERSQMIQRFKKGISGKRPEWIENKIRVKMYREVEEREAELEAESREVEQWEMRIKEKEKELEKESSNLNENILAVRELENRSELAKKIEGNEKGLKKLEFEYSELTEKSKRLRRDFIIYNEQLQAIYAKLDIPESKIKQRQVLISNTQEKIRENELVRERVKNAEENYKEINEKNKITQKCLLSLEEKYSNKEKSNHNKIKTLVKLKKNIEFTQSELNSYNSQISESQREILIKKEKIDEAEEIFEQKHKEIVTEENRLFIIEKALNEKLKLFEEENNKFSSPVHKRKMRSLTLKVSEIKNKESRLLEIETNRNP
ncbi:unnamed protein product [Blepharisma stoltei]|uniref:Uncharacterized protein n=1 Tax=Blepharisma stoltei TaxID=1481888 RepID=A0AAU9JV94_9CILI|nr:unnamed protein product [Blepharisma stoltei]